MIYLSMVCQSEVRNVAEVSKKHRRACSKWHKREKVWRHQRTASTRRIRFSNAEHDERGGRLGCQKTNQGYDRYTRRQAFIAHWRGLLYRYTSQNSFSLSFTDCWRPAAHVSGTARTCRSPFHLRTLTLFFNINKYPGLDENPTIPTHNPAGPAQTLKAQNVWAGHWHSMH